jgi:hypothetical protein
MALVKVQQANFDTKKFELRLINPAYIVSVVEHELAQKIDDLSEFAFTGNTRVCEVTVMQGIISETIYLHCTLEDLQFIVNGTLRETNSPCTL